MSRKSIGQLRFTVGKNKHTLFDNLEVSVDKIRHKVSQTISSFDYTRKNKSKSKQSQTKQSKNSSKPKTKRSEDSNIIINAKSSNHNQKKKSINKHHHTEVQYSQYTLQSNISKIKQRLLQIDDPKGKIKQIIQYYKQINQVIQSISEQPLQELLRLIHKMYTSPLSELFESAKPYEKLLERKRKIQSQIQAQLNKNNELSLQLASLDQFKQIERLNQIIESQRRQIQQLEEQRNDDLSKVQTTLHQINIKSKKQKHLKINLKNLKNDEIVGYHDEFMSKLPDMSQSWRQQALREKRY